MKLTRLSPTIVITAVLGTEPGHAQSLMKKLKERLGPAANVVETVAENRAAFEGFSEEEEIEIARNNAAQFDAQTQFVDDARLETYLNQIVQRLVAQADPRPFEYRLKVVGDSSSNAFTFGAGYLYVNAGLLACMDN